VFEVKGLKTKEIFFEYYGQQKMDSGKKPECQEICYQAIKHKTILVTSSGLQQLIRNGHNLRDFIKNEEERKTKNNVTWLDTEINCSELNLVRLLRATDDRTEWRSVICNILYTLWSIKTEHYIIVDNFVKCEPIFTTFGLFEEN